LQRADVGVGVKSCKLRPYGHFCCRMYRSAAVHSVRDRRTGGQTDRHRTAIGFYAWIVRHGQRPKYSFFY